MGEVVFLQNKRISFAHLDKPHSAVQGGRLTYSCDFLLDETDPEWQAIMQAIQNQGNATFKEHAPAVLQQIHQDRRSRCYGWGQEKVNNTTMQPYPEYVGKVYIGALNENQPQIIKADGNPIPPTATLELQTAARALYSGCRVNASIDVWAQNNTSGRGIRAKLLAIQFAADDQPLGASDPDTSDMFKPVAGAPAPVANGPGVAPGFPPQPPAAGMQPPPATQGQPVPGAPVPPIPGTSDGYQF